MLKQVDVKRRLTLLTTNVGYSKLLCCVLNFNTMLYGKVESMLNQVCLCSDFCNVGSKISIEDCVL